MGLVRNMCFVLKADRVGGDEGPVGRGCGCGWNWVEWGWAGVEHGRGACAGTEQEVMKQRSNEVTIREEQGRALRMGSGVGAKKQLKNY